MDDERYQGIAKPVYDILGSHMGFGAKAKPNRMIIDADHHKISFEIQAKLRQLGYHKLPKDKPPLLRDEDLFMNFYHDGYNPEEEGADIERFIKSRDGKRAIEIAQAQLDICVKHYEDEMPEYPKVKCNSCRWKGSQDKLIKFWYGIPLTEDVECKVYCPVCGNEDIKYEESLESKRKNP